MAQQQTVDHDSYKKERKRLLAQIHAAKEALAWSDVQYRLMLSAAFNVPTATALNNEQLKVIVNYFRRQGWEPKSKKISRQVNMLQKRALEFTAQIPGGEKGVSALCLKLCGVQKIQWCKDAGKLKRLLAAMGNIRRTEVGPPVFLKGEGHS